MSVGRNRTIQLLVVTCAVLFCAAPTPGDVGGCGQEAVDLDPGVFFASKQAIDCDRCRECGFASDLCLEACDESTPIPRDFPEGCFPLVHDGEVCLRALIHASCGEYERYVRDGAPETPSECNFCPLEEAP